MADGQPCQLAHDDVLEERVPFLLSDDVEEERLLPEVRQPAWRRASSWHVVSASCLLVALAFFGARLLSHGRQVPIDIAVVNLAAKTPMPAPSSEERNASGMCAKWDPTKTCKWTLNSSCPGQKRGSIGKARRGLDPGYHCCCEQGLWKKGFPWTDPCAGLNPADYCKWTTQKSCPGQKWGTYGLAAIRDYHSDNIGFQCCCEQQLFRKGLPNTVAARPASLMPRPKVPVPSPAPTSDCASNFTCGCMSCNWTLKYNCPGQAPGTSGFAGNKSTVGFKCCCEQGLWRTVPDPRPRWASLFCFSLMWTSGYEPELMKFQLDQKTGIFGCDWSAVYNGGSKSFNLGAGALGPVITTAIPDMPLPHEKGRYGRVVDGVKQTTFSWLNVPSWVRLWEQVRDDGLFKEADWTAKLDPDAVFFADRLRGQLRHFDSKKAVYIQNENCYNDEFHFSGALEVFSSLAVEMYLQGYPSCKEELPWQGWSEDYFMEFCMNWLEVDYNKNHKLLSNKGSCVVSTTGCGEKDWAAFHPFKSLGEYAACHHAAIQTQAY